jgi:hypothetical protein
MRAFELLFSLSLLCFALAIPSIRRATLPDPKEFAASKTVESAIPQLLNHAHQSIKKGHNGVANFPINGASGKAEIFDDIPVCLLKFLSGFDAYEERNILHLQYAD